MTIRLKNALLAAALAAGAASPAFACNDSALNPEVFDSIRQNATLGAVLAAIPCAAPTPTTYQDALGRSFEVYTWNSENKSITIETFENRVFTKTSQNLALQSKSVTPAEPVFDPETGVLTVPVLSLSNGGGGATVVYDAQVMLTDNGNWSLLSYDTARTGTDRYNLDGYAKSSLDLGTGRLAVPNLRTDSGVSGFMAQLNPDGSWTDISPDGAAGRVPLTEVVTPAPSAPSYDAGARVVTLPAMTLVEQGGTRVTVYDAQMMLTENGEWSLLTYTQLEEGQEAPYDLVGYTPGVLDLQQGALSVPGLKEGDATYAFRARLNEDGTWVDMSDAGAVGVITNNTIKAEAVEATMALAGQFSGLEENGIVVVAGRAYRNVGTCSIPSGIQSTEQDPASAEGATYQVIPNDPTLTVYQHNGSRYLAVQGWAGTCQVEYIGTAP